jgi:putative transcriptional regulator
MFNEMDLMTRKKEVSYLQNYLLVAMPSISDQNYHHAVMYICEHNENGAVGIMINRPTTINLAEVLTDMKIAVQDDVVRHIPVLFGGPVHQERGFVIHRPKGSWRSTLEPSEDTYVTTSRDILESLAIHQGPSDVLIALGCSAWEPGQLEQELVANHWLSVPATTKIVFETAFESRYTEAIASLGISLTNLSDEIGHG